MCLKLFQKDRLWDSTHGLGEVLVQQHLPCLQIPPTIPHQWPRNLDESQPAKISQFSAFTASSQAFQCPGHVLCRMLHCESQGGNQVPWCHLLSHMAPPHSFEEWPFFFWTVIKKWFDYSILKVNSRWQAALRFLNGQKNKRCLKHFSCTRLENGNDGITWKAAGSNDLPRGLQHEHGAGLPSPQHGGKVFAVPYRCSSTPDLHHGGLSEKRRVFYNPGLINSWVWRCWSY